MEKDRNKKLVMIAALVVVFSLTIGFAAFSNVLNIGSSATVTPDSSNFSVLFSSSNTSQATDNITGVGTGGATGGNAVISGTRLSGISANFTEPGQKVTYTLYAHNVGGYVAYLSNISFGSGKSCVAGTGTTDSLVQAACDDINVNLKVGDKVATGNILVTGHGLVIDAYEEVVITIEYKAGGTRADGSFNVTFGDISLVYSSVEGGGSTGTKLINFSFKDLDGSLYTLQAEEGMTWEEFINSDYNNGLCLIHCSRVSCVSSTHAVVGVLPRSEITSGVYEAEITRNHC